MLPWSMIMTWVLLAAALVATVSLVMNVLLAIRDPGDKRVRHIRLAVASLAGAALASLAGAYFRGRARYLRQDLLADFVDMFPSPWSTSTRDAMQTALM
jgi:multisubunit Na+/H+ antiporter MnhB subunit